jgi:5-methylthioadenosine/S-adenosylhomocysteine deaminase
MSILIKNALVITQNEQRQVLRGDVLVDGGLIQEVGHVVGGADQIIDASGDILLPGLINTHTHVAMSIMKGAADDIPFKDFLDRVFAIDAKRTPKDVEVGAELGCLEMIRGGTTTFVDMYYDEDAIAQAVERSGLRGVLCWTVLDEQYTTQKGNPLDNCKRFHQRFGGREKVIPGIALQGVYVCSEETFMDSKEYAIRNDLLLHLHLSETRKEVYDHKNKTGMRPTEWLDKIGFLNSRCLAAHATWLTMNEIKILARCGVSISTCPVSNMKLATGGVAPIPEMLQAGNNISIGTDGSTTNNSLDMFGEMKTLALLQKSSRWDPTIVSAQQAFDFATVGGARAIGMGGVLGQISKGCTADLILLDGKAPNLRPITMSNVVSNIVYSGSALNVKTTMCGGQVLMLDRKLAMLDEDSILARADEAANALLSNQ